MFASFLWFLNILGQSFECSRIFDHPVEKVVESIDILMEVHPDTPEAYAYFGGEWRKKTDNKET